MNDLEFVRKAVKLSEKSINEGGFPVGALIVLNNKIIGEGISNGKKLKDATSHAEIDAIRKASLKIEDRDLNGATLYSSLEPCLMCFSACYWAKVSKIVYACRKEILSKLYYEGLHDLNEINKKNNSQINLIHLEEMEEEALSIINSSGIN